MKSYIYKRRNEDLMEIEKLINQPCETYIASDRDNSVFQRLKRDIERETGLLVISSISIIGSNTKEIVKELTWLHDRHVPTVVADFPATWIFGDLAASDLVLRVIIDVYSPLQEYKKFKIMPKTGRKKIEFPKNWKELYDKWSSGAITSKEFIERSGLKKGTFYHLVTEYRTL